MNGGAGPGEARIQRWLGTLREAGFEQSSLSSYEGRLRRFVKWIGEQSLQWDALVPAEIDRYIKRSGLSRMTLRRDIGVLRSFYGWAIDHDGLDAARNPVARRRVRAKRRQMPRPNERQWRRLVNWFDRQGTPTGYRNAALFAVLGAAGLRVSEAVALRVGSVRREARFYVITVPAIKSREEREVPCGAFGDDGRAQDLAAARLSRWLVIVSAEIGLQAGDPLFPAMGVWPAATTPTRAMLLSRGEVQAMATQTVWCALRAGVLGTQSLPPSARLPLWMHPHSLRALWASTLIARGVPATDVRVLGGWVSPASMETYIRGAAVMRGSDVVRRGPRGEVSAADREWGRVGAA